MKGFYAPAIKLSNRLNFKAKFLLVSILCLLPLLFFFMVLAGNKLNEIEQAEFKLKATNYIVPLRKLSEHIAQTRGMTNVYLNGNKGVEGKIREKRNTVEQHFAALIKVDKELGNTFTTAGIPQQLQQEWQQITNSAFSGQASQVFSQYTQLIIKVIDFMDTIGRQGKMLQDSDAANSYIINSLLHTIPAQVEALGKLRGKGSGVLAANALTTDNKLKVAALASTENALKLQKDITYLFEEAPEIKQQLNTNYSNAKTTLEAYLALANTQIINASSAQMAPTEFFQEGTNTISALLTLFDSLQPTLVTRMESHISKANSQILAYIVMIVVVTLLLIYIYSGIYLAIRQSLRAMKEAADSICDGNLNVRLNLDAQDELRYITISINEIVEGVSRAVLAIKNSSVAMAQSADDIANASESAAEGLMNQSNELTMTSAAVTEMSTSIAEVAQNTELGSEAAQQATTNSANSREVVNQSIESIQILADNINTAVQGVMELKDNSNSINNILDVIKGIAEQTNLLALNAAIEAARAGEQGRGFAVVADEVRTLAQRTQDSTLEIQSMIELIQQGITNVSDNMSKSQELAISSVEYSNKADQAINSITESVDEISNMSMQIATAAEQQSCVSEEIAQSIVKITDVANESSQGAKTLVESGSRIASMSKEMRLIINRYDINEEVFNTIEDKYRLIKWQPKYVTGVDEVDRQHRRMVDMMNEAHILASQGRSSSAIASSLSALLEYTKVHFQWEESYFDSFNYPKSSEHKEIHAKLVNELDSHIHTLAKANNTATIDKELDKLNSWLLNHIEHSDKDYVRHIRAVEAN